MIVAILVASDICDDNPTVREIDTAMAERARARIATVLPVHDGGAS